MGSVDRLFAWSDGILRTVPDSQLIARVVCGAGCCGQIDRRKVAAQSDDAAIWIVGIRETAERPASGRAVIQRPDMRISIVAVSNRYAIWQCQIRPSSIRVVCDRHIGVRVRALVSAPTRQREQPIGGVVAVVNLRLSAGLHRRPPSGLIVGVAYSSLRRRPRGDTVKAVVRECLGISGRRRAAASRIHHLSNTVGSIIAVVDGRLRKVRVVAGVVLNLSRGFSAHSRL